MGKLFVVLLSSESLFIFIACGGYRSFEMFLLEMKIPYARYFILLSFD